MKNFKKKFQEFCESNKFEKNDKQIEVINLLEKFFNNETKSSFFFKKKKLQILLLFTWKCWRWQNYDT